MNKRRRIYCFTLLMLWCLQVNSSLPFQLIQSSGMLHFKNNGQLFVADNTHARAYAIQQNGKAYLKAANSETLVIDVQWDNMNTTGEYQVTSANGTAQFIILHKTYSLLQPGDYVKIKVNSIKQAGAFLLLQGNFTARLHDKNGNDLLVTEGQFETFKL